MRIRALTSFAGVVTLTKDDVYDCKDEEVAKELCRAGLAISEEPQEELKPQENAEEQKTEHPVEEKAKGGKRKGKKDED